MKQTLGKEERLKSKKIIEKLYTNGNYIKVFPLRLVFIQTEHTSNFPAQVGFSVPKRNFKHAVDRNRIKRLLRESYRIQKNIIYDNFEKPYVFMISYLAKEELNYTEVSEKMLLLLTAFINKIKKDEE